jgi:hypothetical protein
LRCIRHDRQIDEAFEFGFLYQFLSPLRYVHCNVADPFDVLYNFQSRRYKSQIAGDRLLERKDLVAEIVDSISSLSISSSRSMTSSGQSGTPIDQRFNRIGDHLLGFMAHEQKFFLQHP